MKYAYGKASRERLADVAPELRRVFIDALAREIVDIAILCGHRDKAEQNRLYNMTPPRTKLDYPHSRHNALPAMAVDAAPWVGGAISENPLHCAHLAGIIQATGAARGLVVRWGGEVLTDQTFQDLWHYEIHARR